MVTIHGTDDFMLNTGGRALTNSAGQLIESVRHVPDALSPMIVWLTLGKLPMFSVPRRVEGRVAWTSILLKTAHRSGPRDHWTLRR